ncbi:MAG: ABC transporter substrate-binding protein [Pseudomonadota bacterium]|jgi:phospholipid transport system substrate-binding protein
MFMKLFTLLLAGVSLLLPAAAQAQETAPDVLVKNVTNEVLEIIRKDKDIQSGNTKRAIDLVEQKVLPHFNFTHMTALAVGRDWRQATPQQQKALIDEFRTLLVRTYSNSLTAYKNQTVDFRPFKMQPGDTDVVVKTQIHQPGGKPITIDYSLEKTPEGWKVYDVVVGGVSLVTNYRDSFSQEVRANGIDGLVKALQAKNRSLAGAVAAGGETK